MIAFKPRNKKYEQFYPSNCYGLMEIIGRPSPGKFTVRFVDTGYEVDAFIYNVKNGKVQDPLAKKAKLDMWNDHYEEFVNNAGNKLVAFAKRGGKFKVRFIDTGYETKAFIENVKAGKINDPYALSFLGIGYIGEFERTPYWKPAKQLWSNMMKRCYNPKDYMGYYGEAFVDDHWKCFANFLEDLPQLENFELWLNGKKEGEVKYNLDKDLKCPGNKTYSKETCMFVTEYENKSAGAINARALDKLNGRYGGESIV